MPTDPKTLLAKFQPKVSKPLPVEAQLCSLRISPEGNTLAGGTFVGTILRWDNSTPTPTVTTPIQGHNGWVQCVQFHPDNKRLFSADSWGRLCCWNFADKEAKPTWEVAQAHDGWIHGLALHKDGSLLATGGRDRTLRLTSSVDGKQIAKLDAKEDVLSVAFHPDGKSLLSGDLKGVIKQWDLEKKSVVREFDAKVMFLRDRIQDVGGVRCFTFNADGSWLIAGGSQPKTGGFVQGNNMLLTFDWATGKLLHTFKSATDNDGYILDLHWNKAGFVMAAASGQSGQGKVLFHQPEDAQPFYAGAIPNVHALAVHPNGKRLIVSATNANSAGNGRPTAIGAFHGHHY